MIKLLLNGKVFWLGSGAFLLDDAANEFRMLTTFYFSGAIRLGFRHGEWAVIKQLELLEDDGSLFERRAPRWLAQLALYPVLCARAFHAQSILCHDNIYTHFDNFALEIHAHWKLLLAHAHYLFKHRATDLLLLLHFDQQMGGRLLAMHGFLSKSKDRLAHHLLTLFELRRIRASLQLRSDAALTLELVTKLELFSFHCTMDCDQHLHADSPAWFVRKIAE